MKKKIIYALSFGIVLFFAASCENNTEEKPPAEPIDTVQKSSEISAPIQYPSEFTKSANNNKRALDSTDFSKADFQLVKARISALDDCIDSFCSYNYCTIDSCLRKIQKCHTITDSIFNRLTNSGRNGFAVFNSDSLAYLLKEDCGKYIRLTCSGTMYKISVVSKIDTTLQYTAHYSIALWQEIAKKTVNYVEVHMAIYDASSGKYLIPFKVHFPDGHGGEIVEVYDLSNDLP